MVMGVREMPQPDKKRTLSLLLILFAALYYIVRIIIFFASVTGSMGFEEEQSSLVHDFVRLSFLAIGALGLLVLPGVHRRQLWGYWGTLAISVYTIVFDIWAFFAIQSSAIAGVIPAAILVGYVLVTGRQILKK